MLHFLNKDLNLINKTNNHLSLVIVVGTPKHESAKSHLYEICAAKKWKSPLFECCKEEGPSHLRM